MPPSTHGCPAPGPSWRDIDPLPAADYVVEHLRHAARGGRRLLLTGPLASGRTATLHAWLATQTPQFRYMVGASLDPDGATPARIIHDLLLAIRDHLGVADALPLDDVGLREALPGWLARLGEASALIVIDDLDRITAADLTTDPDWLPAHLPPGVVLVAVAERGLVAEQLRELGWECVDINRDSQRDALLGDTTGDLNAAIRTAAAEPAAAAALAALALAPRGLDDTRLAAIGGDPTPLPATLVRHQDGHWQFTHPALRDAALRTLLPGSADRRALCARLAEAADTPLEQAQWRMRAADWTGLMDALTRVAALTDWPRQPLPWQTLWEALPARDTAASHLVEQLNRYRRRDDLSADVMADIHVTAGRILDRLDVADAAAYVRRSGYEHLRQQAPESAATAAIAHQHAVGDLADSASARAVEMLRMAQRSRSARLGPDDPATRSSRHALAAMLEAGDDLDGAIAEYAGLVADHEQRHGRDDPGLLPLLANLGAAQRAANRLEQARGPFERCVKIARRVQPSPAPALAAALDNLGGLLYAGGDHEGAEARYRESLDLTRKLFGAEHAATGAALHNLGTTLDARERFAEAQRCFRDAVAIRTRALGREHAETATSLHNLAGVLDVTGQREEAESLYREAIGIWREVVGPEHPATATSINNLADLLREDGRLAEAEPLYRENLALWTTLYGEDHPNTIMTAAELGGLQADAGRRAEAEPLLRQAVTRLEQVMGLDSTLHVDSLCRLAALLRDQGRAAEGVALLEATYERAAGTTRVLSPALQKLRRHLDGLRKAAGDSSP